MDAVIKSKLESNIVKFQVKIRKNLQLYLFSKDAIASFCKQNKGQFKDYEFKNFLSKFKKINFKENSEIQKIKHTNLVSYGDSLIKKELANLIFILNISDFEAWLLEFFYLVFANDHSLLLKYLKPDKNSVELSVLVGAENLNEVWQKIIERYISGKSYKGMINILKDLLSCCNIKIDSSFETIIGEVSENSLCRNLIIHNRGIVNTEYIKKAGKYSRYEKIGLVIDVSENYLFQEVDNLLHFMQSIRKKIIKP
jgi:hypothetical protein